jgi:tight adherence protein C
VSGAALLAAAAAVLAAAAIVDLAAAAGERGRGGRDRGRARPAFAAALARVGRRLGAPAPPADLARRIDAAGASPALRVADVMAVKAGAAVLALVASAPVAAALPGRLGPVAAVAAPAGGFLLPDLWLARRIRRRGRAMAAELADVLDLLRVAVDAGLSPARAVQEVGRRRTARSRPSSAAPPRGSSSASRAQPCSRRSSAAARPRASHR